MSLYVPDEYYDEVVLSRLRKNIYVMLFVTLLIPMVLAIVELINNRGLGGDLSVHWIIALVNNLIYILLLSYSKIRFVMQVRKLNSAKGTDYSEDIVPHDRFLTFFTNVRNPIKFLCNILIVLSISNALWTLILS